MNRLFAILSALLVLCTVATTVQAQTTKDELKVRFRAREPEERDLKRQGKIGETIDGYLEIVDGKAAPDETISSLVNDENADRRRLYQILADEINKEHPEAKDQATAETIALRNARRNIEHAGPTDLLRVAKDQWIRARDFPRFEKLNTLKTQGKVGETTAGFVEIVKIADRGDASIARLVDEENAARTADYKALAERDHLDVSVVAKQASTRNIANARIGDMVKSESGSWQRK